MTLRCFLITCTFVLGGISSGAIGCAHGPDPDDTGIEYRQEAIRSKARAAAERPSASRTIVLPQILRRDVPVFAALAFPAEPGGRQSLLVLHCLLLT